MENYIQIKNVEFNTALEMVHKQVLPAAFKYIGEISKSMYYLSKSEISSESLKLSCKKITECTDNIQLSANLLEDKALNARNEECLEKRAQMFFDAASIELSQLRNCVNCLEQSFPKDMWPFPSNTDLLFYL